MLQEIAELLLTRENGLKEKIPALSKNLMTVQRK